MQEMDVNESNEAEGKGKKQSTARNRNKIIK